MPKPEEVLSDVKVELDEKNQPIVKETPKDEPKYVRVEDLEKINQAINNTREYTNRKQAELSGKIDQLLAQQRPTPQVEKPKDEWDERLQKDWKGTVEQLAAERTKQILAEEREAARVEADRQRGLRLMDDNKRKVLEKHKELYDETSDKAQVFKKVIEENPDYLQNPFGPVLAMRDMEDRLRDSGYVDEPTKRVVEKEVVRQTRANAGGMPRGSANPSQGKTVTLTKDQKDFCDQNGIKYENYGKFAVMTASKGSVEA